MQGYYEYADYIDREDICKSLPLILVHFIWVCRIPNMTESDARMR